MARPSSRHSTTSSAAARSLEIHPLTADRFGDLAALFNQGGDPKWCWCTFFRVRGVYWGNSTPQENRARLQTAVHDLAREDRSPGLVAYRDGEAVGWVSLGPRDDFERLQHSNVLGPLDDRPVWSIVCFVVSRRARRQGVASALLEAAVSYARDRGATLLEAYPVDTTGERISAASAYHGTLSMFERAGFEVVARRRAAGAKRDRPIVRRRIRATRGARRAPDVEVARRGPDPGGHARD